MLSTLSDERPLMPCPGRPFIGFDVSVPSMMNRFSGALAPSIEMPPSLGSAFAPGMNWMTLV